VAEREQTNDPALAYFIGGVGLETAGDGIGNPGVAIMADHDCLWGSGGAAGVDEGGTATCFLRVHAPFYSVFLLGWLVAE
jgi:hypothetical protein